MKEIDRIARNTQWNGMTILDGDDTAANTAAGEAETTVAIQVGDGSGQTMNIKLLSWVPEIAWNTAADMAALAANADNADYAAGPAQVDTAYGAAVLAVDTTNDNQTADSAVTGTQDKFIDIKTEGAAAKVITQIDKAITAAASERATYGAYINRLEYAQDNLMNVAQNTDASRSRIEDADYAAETSELARTQIISQASTAMLAQANQSKQSVLALLQG
jgi:flagellin